MGITRAQQIEAVRAKRRRDVRLKIVLPFMLALLGVLLLTIVAAVAPRTSTTADILMMVLLLCPWLLILFGAFIGLVAAVYGMGRVNSLVVKPLDSAGDLTFMARDKVSTVANAAATKSVELSARTAPLEKWMDEAFLPKNKSTGDKS
jgi:high-affinity K+ transport system ATPase subunit B